MTTGYTEKIENGKITDLSDFMMECARRFFTDEELATTNLNDRIPNAIEITEEYEYFEDKIDEAREMIDDILGMTPEECDRAAMEEYQSNVVRRKARQDEIDFLSQAYGRIYKQIQSWNPPVELHDLKHFMWNQLELSFNPNNLPWNYEPPTLKSGDQWKKDAFEQASDQFNFYVEKKIAFDNSIKRKIGFINKIYQEYFDLKENVG